MRCFLQKSTVFHSKCYCMVVILPCTVSMAVIFAAISDDFVVWVILLN